MAATNLLKQITRVAFGVLAFAIVANLAYPGLLVPFLHLKYRSPYCSAVQAAEDFRIQRNQHSTAERIGRSSVVVRSDRDLMLVRSPEGEFWIPASDEKVLPVLLAQSGRGIYWSDGWDVKTWRYCPGRGRICRNLHEACAGPRSQTGNRRRAVAGFGGMPAPKPVRGDRGRTGGGLSEGSLG